MNINQLKIKEMSKTIFCVIFCVFALQTVAQEILEITPKTATNIETNSQISNGAESSIETTNIPPYIMAKYDNAKSMYLDKEFVYVGYKGNLIGFDGMEDLWNIDYALDKANGLIELYTDTVTIHVPEGSVWSCVDVQIKNRENEYIRYNDKRSPIVLIFDNPVFGRHYCYLENDKGEPYKALIDKNEPLVCGRFQLKTYYDEKKAAEAVVYEKRKTELTKRYGAKNANLILVGKVKIGWTKEMCEESWGKPSKINRTINSKGTFEQWVYRDAYLYFEGNKLTTIQD